MGIKSAVKRVPLLGPAAAAIARKLRAGDFRGSADYWEQRYVRGGNSGAGSYDRLAEFKAAFLNDFVARHDIHSVAEFGSGDGAQLERASYPEYIGIDISETAIALTKKRFAGDPSKRFLHSSEVPSNTRLAELSLSLDVVYHLVEDESFETYMRSLFDAASRYVIVYSSNDDEGRPVPHVRHRRFTDWVESHRPDFVLKERVPNAYPFDEDDPDNSSFADFYIFERKQPV